jgi:osmotically inducible protein OsmC
MVTIKRTSTATWQGDLETGSGHIGVGRTELQLPFSLKTRMGGEPATNPEELLASALSGCYSMSLANELAANGTPAQSINSTATVHLVQGEGGFGIPTVDLSVTADVEGIDAETFQKVATTAHEGCPVSRLFRADVRLTARLTGS